VKKSGEESWRPPQASEEERLNLDAVKQREYEKREAQGCYQQSL